MSDALLPVDFALAVVSPADRSPAAVYLASLSSERSRQVMTGALRTVVALFAGRDLSAVTRDDVLTFPWAALRYAHTAALRSKLSAGYAPATANRLLAAVKGTLKAAWRLSLLSAEAYHRAIDVPNIKGETLPAGRDLSTGELLALVQVCKRDVTPAGVRDAAMLGLLYTTGLRRSELAALQVGDFTAEGGQLRVKQGKGNKQRTVYVTGGALKALTDWLSLLQRDSGPLFAPILKNGAVQAKGISAQTVYDMLQKRAAEAGVADFSPHDLRRTFVGDMLERGVDIATVSKIAGHASVHTTGRYDRRPEVTKKQAADKLHFPY